ncbi:MAG: F0F1 ATP synthase subunit A [Candidatus Kapaibacterium sp.]
MSTTGSEGASSQGSHEAAGMAGSAEHAAAGATGGHHAVDVNSLPREKVFDHLLSELGDHHELSMGFVTAEILPVIVVDDAGVHAWSNPHAMEHEGSYVMFHSEEKALARFNGQPVKAQNGTAVLVDGKPQTPKYDLSVTNLVVYEWLAILVMVLVVIPAGRRYKKSPASAPRGMQNAFEMLVVYLRDEVIRPNIGTDRVTNGLMPYFLALFFFIFILNYIGLLPGMHAATGAIGFTAALALTALFVVNITAMREAGVKAWFAHLLGGAPVYLSPIMVPIEFIGIFTKPFALTVRLFANMTAGHIVLLTLVGLIFFCTKLWGPAGGYGTSVVSVGFSVFVYFIETLVCFLQAYIFTMLTAVFTGLAIGDHKSEDPHGAHH